MNPNQLPIIRLALSSGVFLFAVIAFFMSPNMVTEDSADLYPTLRIAFAGMAILSLLAMNILKRAVNSSSGSRRAGLTLAGWALGEGSALFGIVILLITGVSWPTLLGVGIMLVAFMMFPIYR